METIQIPVGEYDELKADRDRLRQWVRDLKADRDRLRQWVRDLQSGMYVVCAYCGHRFEPGSNAASMIDVLKEHIERCPEHPMSALEADRDRWKLHAELLGRAVKASVPSNCELCNSHGMRSCSGCRWFSNFEFDIARFIDEYGEAAP